MKKRTGRPRTTEHSPRFLMSVITAFFALVCVCALFLIKSKEMVFEANRAYAPLAAEEKNEVFPLGVDPTKKIIVENPEVEAYVKVHKITQRRTMPHHDVFNKTLAMLAQFDWYQNLASPISRILVIDSGERKEEVARNFSKILRWDDNESLRFTTLVAGSSPSLEDGKFTPGRYVVNKDASPEEVATMLLAQFDAQILSRYPEEVAEVVPLHDALTIASLLEREAYDFEDMRYISGIIWNRLFADMNLQLDASLQYAKASQDGTTWWPVARPEDKFITSPFNTYQHKGLPPAPIANPSREAILAALNPKNTNCIFYFHDQDGGFHCTQTYQEHVALLKKIYGKGQ